MPYYAYLKVDLSVLYASAARWILKKLARTTQEQRKRLSPTPKVVQALDNPSDDHAKCHVHPQYQSPAPRSATQ